jgi:hypothetical protein
VTDLFTPIARNSDPSTSHAGARAIEPKRGTHASQVLATIRAYPKGLTALEVERYTLIRGAWKRVSDLKNAGLIRTTGEVRDGGEVYIATEAA